MTREKVTIDYMMKKKANGEKMARTALYDFPMAVLAEEAGIEIINMGDSIANVAFGYDTTLQADLDVMIEHAKAVRRGTPSAFIMGDMPFLSYEISTEEAIRNAGRYIRDAGMDAVKIEGGLEIIPTIEALTKANIPVIGHTGLTPQSVVMLGGYKTQGRSADAAYKMIEVVKEMEKAGAVAIVIEAVPQQVAKIIYDIVEVPLLGTGCGPYSDSPMINFYDMLGFYEKVPRFVKKYGNLRNDIIKYVGNFVEDVKTGGYPQDEHCYNMTEEEEEKLLNMLK